MTRQAVRGCARPSDGGGGAAAACRVLHVFGVMDRGGAETRTLETMRAAAPRGYRFDFCVLGERPGAYAGEIARLGGRILPCPLRPRSATFPLRLYALLRRGRYDVLHSHVHQFSGVVLLIGRLARVPTRIAHLRSPHDGHAGSRRRRVYRRVARALIDRHATHVIGVSAAVMEAVWGFGWRRDPRRRVIYNGVAPAPRLDASARAALRRALGLPEAAPVVLHVGRFAPAKNHAALIAIAARVLAARPDALFVLVGDGPLRTAIEQAVAAGGLAGRVRFAGARDDVPSLLQAGDLLVHPSRWEGLPGVVLEAVAAGLPVIASPIAAVAEIARLTSLVTTCDPADPDAFARAIVGALAPPGARAPVREPAPALPSIFQVANATERLLACYR